MRAAVLIFPGTNAEVEMVHTLRQVMGISAELAWHRDRQLPADVDLVTIPGGFSYGDYLRAGAIAKSSPIITALRQFVDQGGLVLGVCNGFQILTEVGLLPGALTRNAHLRFECGDVFVKAKVRGPFTASDSSVLRVPIAHAEGRYHASEQVLSSLQSEQNIAFQYCNSEGQVTDSANPNGSIHSIAGVYGGPSRNVLGLMPHPERASEPFVGGSDGQQLFRSVIAWHDQHLR